MNQDRENTVGELTRLAELGQIFARHGLKNLGSALGISPVSKEAPDPRDLRPASVVALLRDIGPVGIKLGQLMATRSDLFTEQWITAFGTLHDQVEPLPFDQMRLSFECADIRRNPAGWKRNYRESPPTQHGGQDRGGHEAVDTARGHCRASFK